MEKIHAVTVTYPGGRQRTWIGEGEVDVHHTQTVDEQARKTPTTWVGVRLLIPDGVGQKLPTEPPPPL